MSSSESETSDSSSDTVPADKKYCVCEYAGCGAKFSRHNRLEIHYRTHTGERPFVCDHPGCGRSYARQQHLRRHGAGAHEREPSALRQTFSCTVDGCEQIYKTAQSLRKHLVSHERRKQHMCNTCGKGFLKRQHLRVHEYQHTGVKPFQCPKEGCGVRFVLPSELRSHERQHDKHRCTVGGCDTQFANWKQLLQHRRQLHRKQHKCSDCDRTFLSNYALRIHKKVHGETRDIFHCPYGDCPRYYYFKNNLKKHTMSSHEGKGFVCPVDTCKKKLCNKHKLDQHSRLHEPNRPAPRPRHRQKPRRDRGTKRGPALPAFTHLTGEPQPELEPQLQPPAAAPDTSVQQSAGLLNGEDMARAAITADRLAWQCSQPSRKKARLAELQRPGRLERMVRTESETESHSDDCGTAL